ncbi:helix-turn-helix domain-containing protein [Clostridium sp. LP20]|uniref:helix-turn-helix domain-containing protein n=1 Tax=Clostridium sp. LP20 TaxID=3418665 RepID=UPI003EE638D7
MEVTKELLEELYFKKNMTQKEVGQVIGLPQNIVSNYFHKYGIKARRVWTAKDIEYLEDHYGLITFKAIAKKLNKTPNGVSIKAKRLGLGGTLGATEYLNSSQLADVLGVDRKTPVRWIKDKGLKASFKNIGLKRKFWRINQKDFWKWAEQNKTAIRWSKVELNILGKEPSWVDKARKDDSKISHKVSTKWSKAEDAILTSYWNSGLLIKDIAINLQRTEAGVTRRAKRLGLKRRSICLPWQSVEVETLINMKLKGYRDKDIAEELGREELNISWKRKELIKKGQLNWTYRENKKVTQAPTKVTEVTV